MPRATVFAVEGERLSVASAAADAVPWPGIANGVRFRPGTNLVEGALDAVGSGPFLALDGDGAALVAVGADGTLLTSGGADGPQAGPRVGSCVAAPRPGTLVATAPGPAGRARRPAVPATGARRTRSARGCPIDGAVRALAARAAGARSRGGRRRRERGRRTSLLALEIGWP